MSAPITKARRIYWHGEGCYCDAVRLPEDAPCPVCDAWPRPDVQTMPNGCRYIADQSRAAIDAAMKEGAK